VDPVPEEYLPLCKFLGATDADVLNNIRVHKKNDMYLYNYSDVVIVPRNHPMLVKCRGLVLRGDGAVLNYPFDRFFNDWENDNKADISWNTAVAQEKLDGSLISVFWNGIDWEVCTRGSFYPNENNLERTLDYSQEFKRLFNNFDYLNKTCSYVFELISDKNRIVTKYDKEFVALIGARNLTTLEEKDQHHLNALAMILEVYRPKQIPIQNIEECKKLFENMRDDEEGLVIIDDQHHRIKLKQESYLKMHRIKALKDEDILDYILGRIELDQEFVHAFPEVEEKINEMMLKWEAYNNMLGTLYNKLSPLLLISRKDFALEVIKYPKYRACLFSRADGKVYKDYVRVDML